MDKHTGSSYDDKAQLYADAQDSKPWNLFFERPGMLSFLPNASNLDVLDAGCGPGFYAKHLVDQGARVTAFDMNSLFVETTRIRTENRALVHQADLAEPLDFCLDSSVDLVISVLVLHYLKDWRPTLQEFYRVLRPDGHLIFSTHHPFTDIKIAKSGDYFATELIEEEWDIGKVLFYRRPVSKITHDLFKSGFLIEELAEPQPVKPPVEIEFPSYGRAMNRPQRLLVRARKPA